MRRLILSRKARRQAGDTIVEVLIAISIVSLVLTSAYIVTNKNAQTMRTIQERTQAQKLVERQIEFLRASSTVPTTEFCFADDQGTITSDVSQCYFSQEGESSTDTTELRYHVSAKPNTPSPHTYKVTATWDKLGGGTGNVTMYYYEQKA